jgi:hypothetical protein
MEAPMRADMCQIGPATQGMRNARAAREPLSVISLQLRVHGLDPRNQPFREVRENPPAAPSRK